MTAQEKIRDIGKKLGDMAKDQNDPNRRSCYNLLCDSVSWSDARIDGMSNDSLVGFIQLSAITVQTKLPNLRGLRAELVSLGFSVDPPN